MSDTPTKAAKASQTPEQALDAAVETLVKAAEAFAKADGTTSHSHTSGAYRVRFQGEQLFRLERA